MIFNAVIKGGSGSGSGGGTGIELNGTIDTFIAAQKITKGDFVSFVYGGVNGTSTKIITLDKPYCCDVIKLSENKVFIVLSEQTNWHLYGVVCTVSGNTVSAGTLTLLSDTQYAGYYCRGAALSDSRVFIAWSGNGTYDMYGMVCDINQKTISVRATGPLENEGGGSASGGTLAVALGTNKVVAIGNNSSLWGCVVTVNENAGVVSLTHGALTEYSNAGISLTLDTNTLNALVIDSTHIFVQASGTTMTGTSTNRRHHSWVKWFYISVSGSTTAVIESSEIKILSNSTTSLDNKMSSTAIKYNDQVLLFVKHGDYYPNLYRFYNITSTSLDVSEQLYDASPPNFDTTPYNMSCFAIGGSFIGMTYSPNSGGTQRNFNILEICGSKDVQNGWVWVTVENVLAETSASGSVDGVGIACDEMKTMLFIYPNGTSGLNAIAVKNVFKADKFYNEIGGIANQTKSAGATIEVWRPV